MPNDSSSKLVSVVVPAYKHAHYVLHALDSVFQQSYDDIELILVDDQSPDNTFELAQMWAEKENVRRRFHRVMATRNPVNLGAHESINRGISLANGEFITILNSDDAYAPTRIESLVTEADRSSASLFFSGVRVIDDKGGWRIRSGLPAELESAADFVSFYPSISFALLKKNIACSTGNLFFSRSLFDEVGPFRAFKYCHDWDFLLRACLITEPVLLPESLYDYRIHGANSFAALKVEQYLEPLAIYAHYFAQCRAGNCRNPAAPWFTNWPGLFEKLITEDSQISWTLDLFGKSEIKLDRMAVIVRNSVRQTV